MKKTLSFFILFLTGAQAYCQSKNNVSLVFGVGSNGIYNSGIGAAGFAGKGETVFGLRYTRRLTGALAIETGIEYASERLLWDYEDAYDPNFTPQRVNIRMLSIPVYANITFLKYLFVDGGFMLDLETSHKPGGIAPRQDGIGLGGGIGGKYSFGHLSLFVNPFLQAHSMIAFHNEGGGRLLNSGVKFGVGFSF